MPRRPLLFAPVLLGIALATPALAHRQVVQRIASGLLAPAKIESLPDGQLLVAEAGRGPNTGRVSLVDRDGRRFTVVDHLPSGLHGPRMDPSGPSGVLLDGSRMLVLVGNGDITIPGAGMNSEIPNPTPASPLFSAVLRFEFTAGRAPRPGFDLPPSAHVPLASGLPPASHFLSSSPPPSH